MKCHVTGDSLVLSAATDMNIRAVVPRARDTDSYLPNCLICLFWKQ